MKQETPPAQVFTTHSSEETIALGRKLAGILRPPQVMVLHGDLGAGKTTLVKGIAAALDAAEPEEVTSPTFTLVHEYQGKLPPQDGAAPAPGRVLLYHIDLYRIEGQRQLETLGLEEMMTPDALLLIEWGERFPWVMAHSTGEIVMEAVGGEERRITLRWRA